MVVLVLVPELVVALLVLLPAGLAWMAVLSTMNASLQLFLPEWVRARGLSVYLTVLFGSQAVGAVLWGVVAAPKGVVPAFLIAAGGDGSPAPRPSGIWPLIDTTGMDRRTVARPEPQLAFDAAPDEGPVVVSITYTIAPERGAHFCDAMIRVRLSRLRTGATQWGLFRDGETPHEFVELFVVASWDEHLRQHSDRLTGTDTEYLDYARSLSDPRAAHLAPHRRRAPPSSAQLATATSCRSSHTSPCRARRKRPARVHDHHQDAAARRTAEHGARRARCHVEMLRAHLADSAARRARAARTRELGDEHVVQQSGRSVAIESQFLIGDRHVSLRLDQIARS